MAASDKRLENLKLPPQSLEAEQALLGAVLLDNAAVAQILETKIGPDDFYREAHGLIFSCMLGLWEENEPADLITLAEALKKRGALEKAGGPAYLAELADEAGTAAYAAHYAEIVKEKSTLRRLIGSATQIIDTCYAASGGTAEALDEAERSILAIRQESTQQSLVGVDSALLNKTFNNLESLSRRGGSVTGVPTGYPGLDARTSGFQPSDLVIIAGRPSMGKTALALNLAINAAVPAQRGDKSGHAFPVAVFSLEMSTDQLLLRLLCSLSRLDLHAVRTGRLRDTDWTGLTEAASKLVEAPIFIDDTAGISVLEIRAKARRLKNRLRMESKELGMVVVDYLQLVRGRGESREQEISEISRSLKALAKELSVPVIALSQLNRQVESRPDKRPMLADLRESGAIEQDADVIAFVFREEFYKRDNEELRGKAELIIGKQRNGPTGSVNLVFHHASTSFLPPAAHEEEIY